MRKLKVLSADNKILFSNFLSLSILQVLNLVLPLITVPYLVRVIGVDKFGLLNFAQALTMYFLIIADFGFNYSATREISIYREDEKKVSEVFSSVMFVKLVLLLLSVVLLAMLTLAVTKINNNWEIYFYTFGIVTGQAFFPIWFFQGIEKMKYITILNFISRLISTVLIFIMVTTKDEFYYVPLINSLGYIVSAIIALVLILKYFKVSFVKPNLNYTKKIVKESSSIFISNIGTTFYSASSILILGFFTNDSLVGIYSSMEKLVVVSKRMFEPLYQALFPWLSRKKANEIGAYIKKMIPIIFVFGLGLSLILYFFSSIILDVVFSNKEILINIKVFKIIAIVPFLAAINMLFNMLYFNAVKAYNTRLKVILSCGIINLILVLSLTYKYHIYGTAISLSITEFFLLIFGFYYYRRTNRELNEF